MTTPAIRAALERLLNDLQCLILKSQGVSGLCRDGDLVTWPDLLKPGGRYSPWIGYAIAAARDALDAEPPDPANGENPPPAMLTENELATSWNQQADEFNRWDSLDSGEQLAWAQARAIARDRADRLPDPAAGGEALLAAPAEGEVADLHRVASALSDEGLIASAHTCRSAATLLQQQAAELAALRAGVVPVAVSERLPGPEDCDEKGRCWFFDPCDDGWWCFRSALFIDGDPAPFTHWRPFHAIPLPAPQGGEVV